MPSLLEKKRKVKSFKAIISIKNEGSKKKKTSITAVRESRVVNSRLKKKSNLIV